MVEYVFSLKEYARSTLLNENQLNFIVNVYQLYLTIIIIITIFNIYYYYYYYE